MAIEELVIREEIMNSIANLQNTLREEREFVNMFQEIDNREKMILEIEKNTNMMKGTKREHFVKYVDELTGLLNFRAFKRLLDKNTQKLNTVGMVYFEIPNLKCINIKQGYDKGDLVIRMGADIIKELFDEYDVYRINASKFVVVCDDILEADFRKRLKILDFQVDENKLELIYGSYWSENINMNVSEIFNLAEKNMSVNKASYFEAVNPKTQSSRDRRKNLLKKFFHNMDNQSCMELKNFMSQNYFDLDMFLNSLSSSEYYPYFGDLKTNVFYITDEMKKTFGFDSNVVQDFLSKWVKCIPHKEDLELFDKDFENLMKNQGEIHDLRYRVCDKDGNKFWIRCFGVLRWNEEEKSPIFLSGAVSKLEYNFTIDPITNLPREEGAITKIQELKYSLNAMTFIGFRLKHFKEINELKGREVSNALIEEISNQISQHFEGKLQLFRLDGLKFLVVVIPEYSDYIEEFTTEIRRLINELYREYNITVRDSCYIAVIREKQKDISPYDIITNISNLLDVAKDTSNDKYVLHSSEDIQTHKAKNQIIMTLNRDVINNFENFRVVIQPVVDSQTFEIASGEMLLRWQFIGKDISPGRFIPVLEKGEQMLYVGKWVFEQAVINAKKISETHPNFHLNFNVSYKQIMDDDFLHHMRRILKKYNLHGSKLVMEITESHYNEDPKKLYDFIIECQKMGMRVALDDFGTGYSSLELLLKYPSDIIKLDRSLIREMTDSKNNKDFISSIVYSCHKFGKKICVEGVEKQKELDAVLEVGCDLIQGYYFYKPLELDDFYKELKK